MQKAGQVPGQPSAPASHKGGGLRGRNDGAGVVWRSARVLPVWNKIAVRAVERAGAVDWSANRTGFLGFGFELQCRIVGAGMRLAPSIYVTRYD
jgi:hypothetical protein